MIFSKSKQTKDTSSTSTATAAAAAAGVTLVDGEQPSSDKVYKNRIFVSLSIFRYNGVMRI